MQCVSLSLFRFQAWHARLWVLGQMGAARLSLPRVPGIGFWKLCGSGTGEGFTPRPNTAVWAILAAFADESAARAAQNSPVFRRWQARSSEHWTVFMTPLAARGQWGGVAPFQAPPPGTPWPQIGAGAPVAALTRATIRPRRLLRFWARVPDISARIGADPNVTFKIGIGELPMLHQVTFSIWPDIAAIAGFARAGGPHAEAIKAVRAEDWFREELYARFQILGQSGKWEGKDPLACLEPAA